MPRADQHDEIELNYLTSGSLTYLMGGRRAVVPAQHLAAFWATVPHQIVEYTGNEPYYVATIPFAWYLKWGIAAQLHDTWLETAVALEIQARLLRMARSLSDVSPPINSERRISMESQDKAEQMACRISRCFEERLTIPQIAAEVDLHPDYASTLFKKTYGTTIVNFITRQRVAHAQRLLLSTESPIINVAEDSGFDSLSRSNRAFKQFTGETPREYRKNLR
ncbi:helix-turn-helix domain-containing protein [Stieleria sedimenti]|uniref:helix-turn-helix domain-containing protein n=1 Tax=Stieleria sedimenti TaxID=2976331 RepID=UPI002B1F8080|nr:helix-turn-helix domain-containing protein [Stieleria sedimenti]